MKTKRSFFILPLVLAAFWCGTAFAQSAMRGLHGDILNDKNGLHAGNKFHCSFYNDGTLGTVAGSPAGRDIRGSWPDDYYGLRHIYLIDGNPFIAAEVLDAAGQLKHIHSTVRSAGSVGAWSSGDASPSGEWWTFLPLPGFANPDTDKVAMTKWRYSWPPAGWPDKSDDPVDPGWIGKWNGYFGKDIFNADEESYFVADDWNNKEFDFYPDSTDLNRKGLGIRMYCRGFQWSNALVDDALFLLFDYENIGTYLHDKVAFAYKIGNNMGDWSGGSDGADDGGAYDLESDLAWQFDVDNINNSAVSEFPNGIGFIGAAFMESPGNPRDGIDNDNDANGGSGKIITEDLWAPRTLRRGDKIVLTDYKTFERSVKTFGVETPDTVLVRYQDLVFKYFDGVSLEEVQNNLVDDNLNGIIDENNGVSYGKGDVKINKYLYLGLRYKDYVSNDGIDNPMIDEMRDDGIDNDGDWTSRTDDLGQDGVAFTNDPGERDGRPTVGEPHFDKTDISESDMIGLTSFSLYKWEGFGQYDDEGCWEKMRPGNLDDLMQNDNVENMWGSGYFPIVPGEIQRFSICIMMAFTIEELKDNNLWANKAYAENYNFTKAPNVPTVRAIPGDGWVTLMWDNFAELSVDPITGRDFEGYRIYRSTDPGFSDMMPITDGKGNVTYRKPLAQFDMKNGIKGFSTVPMTGMGIHLYLGDDTGITHVYVDSTAKNGFNYYYAVVSYDRGDQMTQEQITQYMVDHGGLAPNPPTIPPTECPKSVILIPGVDEPVLGSNVVKVKPEAPAAGYKAAGLENLRLLVRPEGVSTALGMIGYSVVDPTAIKDGHLYRVTFGDTLVDKSISGTKQWTYITKDFTLVDATAGDTLIAGSEDVLSTDEQPLTDGFQLKLYGDSALVYDASRSSWNRSDIFAFAFAPYRVVKETTNPEAADYRIEFGELGLDTSTEITSRNKPLAAIPVNFKVWKLYPTDTGEVALECRFAFREQDGKDGVFSAFGDKNHTKVDEIIILNEEKQPGFQFSLDRTQYDSLKVLPSAGDVVTLRLRKPFMRHDVFEFTARKATVNEDLAKADLNKIKVVPNPYVAANSWEPPNLYTTGRGPRELHFTHLPMECTIKIFNVRGQLVRVLEHRSDIDDGTEVWDMRTKDQLDIAYGVYVYYVDAGKLGQIIGKFAVIK